MGYPKKFQTASVDVMTCCCDRKNDATIRNCDEVEVNRFGIAFKGDNDLYLQFSLVVAAVAEVKDTCAL
jgi:hypothetical protein